MITLDDIRAARARIAPHIRVTPVMAVDGILSRTVTLKLEHLQHSGSFKVRGAFNSLLSQPVPLAGVTAASGGNHGAAVALAASTLGHAARIFVPDIAAPAKIARIENYGASIVVGGARYADAAQASEAYAHQSGALSIHAYDSAPTIAGQGTLGAEWEEQSPGLDIILVAVGGGGLIAGLARWYAGRVKIIGVEPKGSRALDAALASGGPVDVDVESVAADSLGARRCGAMAFEIAQRYVDQIVLVEDKAIMAARSWLWDRLRLVVEPGGAAALAALLSKAYCPPAQARIGVLLCGANTDLATL